MMVSDFFMGARNLKIWLVQTPFSSSKNIFGDEALPLVYLCCWKSANLSDKLQRMKKIKHQIKTPLLIRNLNYLSIKTVKTSIYTF